jgi:hypothetical protein
MLPLRTTHFALAVLFISVGAYGQIPTGSRERATQAEVEELEAKVVKVIAKAEDFFKQGKLSLDDNKLERARDEFDKAVDVILESGIDVRANQRLQTYYLDLVERIYRLETPNQQRAQPGHPSGLPSRENVVPMPTRTGANTQEPAIPQVGFREQKFEPSPLDELSKLVLVQGEQSIRPNDVSDLAATRPMLPCPLRLSEAPELRGFRLGMSIDDVRKRLVGVMAYFTNVERPTDLGFMKVSFRPVVKAGRRNSGLEDIVNVSIEFLDGRLTAVEMGYDSSIKWRGVDEFAARVSESLKLPTVWRRGDSNDSGSSVYSGSSYQRNLYCDGFTLNAEVLVRPKLRVFNQSTSLTIERRKAAKEERQRQAFKP